MGNVYICDFANFRIRKVSNGVITTIAGTGVFGYTGDNGPAVNATLTQPVGIAVDSADNVCFADSDNSAIRKISGTGTITTVAGGSIWILWRLWARHERQDVRSQWCGSGRGR